MPFPAGTIWGDEVWGADTWGEDVWGEVDPRQAPDQNVTTGASRAAKTVGATRNNLTIGAARATET